jgi:hypothetical protein
VWHCLPPRGRSGGILLGVNAAVLDVSLVVEGEFLSNSISAIRQISVNGSLGQSQWQGHEHNYQVCHISFSA